MNDIVKKLNISISDSNGMEATMVEEKRLLNHINTYHAGVLFLFSEIVGKQLIKKLLNNKNISTELIESKINYLQPATGVLKIKIPFEKYTGIKNESFPVELNIKTDIINEKNEIVTKTDFIFKIEELK